MYEKGQIQETRAMNRGWANYLNNNFSSSPFAQEQQAFNSQNTRLNKAINNKYYKGKAQKREMQRKKGEKEDSDSEEEVEVKKRVKSVSDDSDEDEMEYRQYKMGKGGYKMKK